jgi:hypothetical protein
VTHNPTGATAFWVDEPYDVRDAGDRRSRYGAYLFSRAHLFGDPDEDGPISDPCEFAARAFTIASAPVMAPGYVREHPRVRGVSWCWDDDRRLAFEIQLVAPLPGPIEQAIRGQQWADWQRHWSSDSWWQPYDNDRPGAYTVVTVRVPLTADVLPTPAYQGAAPDVAIAKQAVGAVCERLNSHLAGILAALDRGPYLTGQAATAGGEP